MVGVALAEVTGQVVLTQKLLHQLTAASSVRALTSRVCVGKSTMESTWGMYGVTWFERNYKNEIALRGSLPVSVCGV